jgi:spermidine/putrescine-binding protein
MLRKIARREWLVVIGSAMCALAFPAAAQQQTLTVQIWGTTWQSVMQEVGSRFEKQTGVKVEPVTQASSGEGLVKLQAMKQKPTVDVWFTTSSVAARAVGDRELFVDIPAGKMTHLGELKPGAHKEGWVAAYYYPIGIIYRPDIVKEPITSWQALWKPSFAGKLGIPNMSMYQGSMLLVAATLNGGSVDNVDPGFEALSKLRPNVAVFYGSDAQARQALAQGEIGVLVAPPSQAKRMRDQGIAVKMMSPKPAPMQFDVMTIVKSGKEELAAKFIDFVISEPIQQLIAERLGMGPVNTKAKPPAELVDSLPKPGDEVAFDDGKVNAQIGKWTERFNSEIAR